MTNHHCRHDPPHLFHVHDHENGEPIAPSDAAYEWEEGDLHYDCDPQCDLLPALPMDNR